MAWRALVEKVIKYKESDLVEKYFKANGGMGGGGEGSSTPVMLFPCYPNNRDSSARRGRGGGGAPTWAYASQVRHGILSHHAERMPKGGLGHHDIEDGIEDFALLGSRLGDGG